MTPDPSVPLNEIIDPFTELRESLALGGKDFLKKIQRLLKIKNGQEEKRIDEKFKRKALRERIGRCLRLEPEKCWQIWTRARLGGERKVDLGREYGYSAAAVALAAAGVTVHAPLRDVGKIHHGSQGLFGKERFAYDSQADAVICPNGKPMKKRTYHQHNQMV
ncbi:MAG: hypothetical protein PHD76_14160, partial [Methylacidiphilales bacterium]|nr:hypothetical protein [Candidatus Methylacidiphilales bacterium]